MTSTLPHIMGPRKLALLMSLLVAALGAVVLAGWVLDIAALKSVFPGLVTMKANTAAGMLLCGAALALLSLERIAQPIRFGTTAVAAIVIAVAAMTLGEDLFGWNPGIDQWLFRDVAGAVESSSPGRMSPPTAFCFVLTGIALALASQLVPMRLRRPILSALGAVVIFAGGLALLGHVSDALLGFRMWNYAGMAMHTALGFVLSGSALLLVVQSESELTWSLDKLSTVGFVIGIAALLAAAAGSYQFIHQLRQDAVTVIHTEELLKTIQEIIVDMGDLESGQRGYIIGGDEHLLARREQTKIEAQSDLEAVRTLSTGNPGQQARLFQLKLLIEQRIDWEEKTIVARKQHGFPAVQRMIASGKGIVLAAKVRGMLKELEGEEYVLLGQRQKQSDAIATKTFLLLPLGVLLSLTMLSLGLFFLSAGICERKRAEQELANSRTQLQAMFDNMTEAIVVLDRDHRIVQINPACMRMHGIADQSMPPEEMLATFEAVLPNGEPVPPNLWPSFRALRGDFVRNYELCIRRKDTGDTMIAEFNTAPIVNEAGETVQVIISYRDITERKQTDATRAQLEQQLRQSQKMEAIGQLTGGVAHDFNNLLGVILGNLDLLERLAAGNDAAVKRVQTAQKAAMRGADLTRRLLVFSSHQKLNPVPTSLQEPIQNMIEMAARALGPEINITTKLDLTLPPILVDAAGLENVLLNLAVNARDAMPKGGSLTISTQLSDLEESYPPVQAEELKPGRYARVTVSDTGHGMSRATLERVFEPFFTTKPRGKGTGLGMAMVYGFVKQSGGAVRIYSELGHGTSVSFYLPLAEHVTLPAEAPAATDLQGQAGWTVLVVDDEVDLLEIAVAYLEEMGCRVFHATDGAGALTVAAREPHIELLLTDVIMPGGMNGVELAGKMRQLNPAIKIVYSSGFPSDALAERSGMRVDGPLLYKPYQRSQFADTIRSAMVNNHAGRGA